MKWEPGQILLIKNYVFEDDGSSKDKFSIVLHCNETSLYLIHTLTTSQNKQDLTGVSYGCSVKNGIPYYFIPAGQALGEEAFSFTKPTFITFYHNVRKESFERFNTYAAKSGGNIIVGKLSKDELKRILKCVLKSKSIPMGIERELQAFKESL